MQKQIIHIAPLQAAKVIGVFYFLISIPFAVLMLLSFSFSPAETRPPLGILIAAPLFYLIFGFVFTAISAWLYNLVAKWIGGIEFTTQEKV